MRSSDPNFDNEGFRLRGRGGSRVDNFSDIVFASALTLIVVSQSVPQTFDELRVVLIGFLPFAICFLIFVSVWLYGRPLASAASSSLSYWYTSSKKCTDPSSSAFAVR